MQELADETLGVVFGKDLLDTRVHDQVHTHAQYSHQTYYYQLAEQGMHRMIAEKSIMVRGRGQLTCGNHPLLCVG
jgi:hypothetical protein